jgi:hypothetical protein
MTFLVRMEEVAYRISTRVTRVQLSTLTLAHAHLTGKDQTANLVCIHYINIIDLPH